MEIFIALVVVWFMIFWVEQLLTNMTARSDMKKGKPWSSRRRKFVTIFNAVLSAVLAVCATFGAMQ